jgi:hypothetical protein
MNRDEQKHITEFIERAVKGQPDSPLQPMDIEADAIIRALFVRNPEAAYRITMLAIAQARDLAARSAPFPASAGVPGNGILSRLFARRPRPEDRPEKQFTAFERSV